MRRMFAFTIVWATIRLLLELDAVAVHQILKQPDGLLQVHSLALLGIVLGVLNIAGAIGVLVGWLAVFAWRITRPPAPPAQTCEHGIPLPPWRISDGPAYAKTPRGA